MEREQYDFRNVVRFANRSRHFQSSHAGHVYVQKYHVGFERLRQLDCIFAVVCFARNRPIGFFGKGSANTATDERVVVHDENAGNYPSSEPGPKELGTIAQLLVEPRSYFNNQIFQGIAHQLAYRM